MSDIVDKSRGATEKRCFRYGSMPQAFQDGFATHMHFDLALKGDALAMPVMLGTASDWHCVDLIALNLIGWYAGGTGE